MKVKYLKGSKKGKVAEVGSTARALIVLGIAEAATNQKTESKKGTKKKGASKRKDIQPED